MNDVAIVIIVLLLCLALHYTVVYYLDIRYLDKYTPDIDDDGEEVSFPYRPSVGDMLITRSGVVFTYEGEDSWNVSSEAYLAEKR